MIEYVFGLRLNLVRIVLLIYENKKARDIFLAGLALSLIIGYELFNIGYLEK
jgi:hypothetical protein